MSVDKKNIFLSGTIESLPFTGKGGGGSPIIPKRDTTRHAKYLKRRFEEAYANDRKLTQRQVAAIRHKKGIYMEFAGQQNHDLVIKSLENISVGIRLLNVKKDDDVIKATIYIPEGKESYFINRLNSYMTEVTEKRNPKHKNFINSIEDIKLAFLDSFWIGKKNDMPTDTPVWCEMWLRVDNNQYDQIEAKFYEKCKEKDIQCDEKSIRFPERLVKLVHANVSQLGEIIQSYEYLAEIRRAQEVTSFFYDLPSTDQREWVDDLISRIEYNLTDTSICILDTGVNYGHPLLVNSFNDDTVHVVDSSWDNSDHKGHGTKMAGIALFYDLQEKLESSYIENIVHQLESVKILPSTGENDPNLYGAITQNAVYLVEIARPNFNRVICMAVTSDRYNTNDGSPTSWSGAIDSLVSGADRNNDKRLFFISAGNVKPVELSNVEYPNANINHSVESPGQAWNAITVGAYSDDIRITDPLFNEYHPVADKGELSPYSSTSVMWDKKWPIKPEILCNGGNVATDGEYYSECEDLSLLTTHPRPMNRLFSTIYGTSSATAQASWMAAQIIAEYPNIWPETVRGLLIHSARYTEKMKMQFCIPDTKPLGRRNLLHTCGYGIPNLEKAIQCLNNSVNLVVEGELQPFIKSGMNEMHIHDIPWPRAVLQQLGSELIEMRVTLSYFIEPGPGEIGWKDKYRYPSCGLRFDVINQNETKSDFKKRVNVKMRGEDRKDSGDGTSGSTHWHFGMKNRDVGSIHSDFREQSAVDLCDANYIAVYPVVGWWRERAHLKCYNNKIRYSLIVSISTPKTEIDLYTSIITQIKIPTEIPV